MATTSTITPVMECTFRLPVPELAFTITGSSITETMGLIHPGFRRAVLPTMKSGTTTVWESIPEPGTVNSSTTTSPAMATASQSGAAAARAPTVPATWWGTTISPRMAMASPFRAGPAAPTGCFQIRFGRTTVTASISTAATTTLSRIPQSPAAVRMTCASRLEKRQSSIPHSHQSRYPPALICVRGSCLASASWKRIVTRLSILKLQLRMALALHTLRRTGVVAMILLILVALSASCCY